MKRPIDNVDAEGGKVPSKYAKKVKSSVAKDFKNELATSDKSTVLNQFFERIKDDTYAYDYLEGGGGCLEIFQLLDKSAEVPSNLVLETVHTLLLQIVARYAQFQSLAEEACRYFLNSHIKLANRMLDIKSDSGSRKVMLKLLTVMAALSRSLSNDILAHVSFNKTMLELLASHKRKRDSTRKLFVQFVLAYVVAGDPATLSLLNRKGLFTAVINGLLYDSFDTVCMVLVALKDHVLEGTKMSKTLKMQLFNTAIIKNLVNLYNWKGPTTYESQNQLQTIPINEEHKTRVNEALHSLLIILCTSHSRGIVFRDQNVGLNTKGNNNLMSTVLNSLENFWEHSYMEELVRKICRACPDLVKHVWVKLSAALEPRDTEAWLNAVEYSSALIKDMEPSLIQHYAKNLTANKLSEIIHSLVAPSSILKIVISNNFTYEQASVKFHVLSLLVDASNSMKNYLISARHWLKPDEFESLKKLLSNHSLKYFPTVESIIKDWTKIDKEVTSFTSLDYLELLLNQLDAYESICPQLLENLSGINLKKLLKQAKKLRGDEEDDLSRVRVLQIRAIKIFVTIEPSMFVPDCKLFNLAMTLAVSSYYETRDEDSRVVLYLLLRSTGLFDECLDEINLWICAISDLDDFDETKIGVLIEAVKTTSSNIISYLDLMEEMLKQTKNPKVRSESNVDRTISPLLLGLLEHLSNSENNQTIRSYLNSIVVRLLHSQTNYFFVDSMLLNEKYQKLISKHVVKYAKAWIRDCTVSVLSKSQLPQLELFSSSFLEGNLTEFIEHFPDKTIINRELFNCFLDQAIFYFLNLSDQSLTLAHLENLEKLVKFALEVKVDAVRILDKILTRSDVLNKFSVVIQNSNKSECLFNTFLVNLVDSFKNLVDVEQLNSYLKLFRNVLLKVILKSIRVPNENNDFNNLIKVIDTFGLEIDQCLNVILSCAKLIELDNVELLAAYYKLLLSVFQKYISYNLIEPLKKMQFKIIVTLLIKLNLRNSPFDTSIYADCLKIYLEIFPKHLNPHQTLLFESILSRSEFCKSNAALANFLLAKNGSLLETFTKNMETISNTKGLMLALLDACMKSNPGKEDVFQNAYVLCEPSIAKALQKPQKAGKHFATFSKVAPYLIDRFMIDEACLSYVKKVHKFEVYEPFHLDMLIHAILKVMKCEDEKFSEYAVNSILTIAHFINSYLKKNTLKQEEEGVKLDEIVHLTKKFLDEIVKIVGNTNEDQVSFRSLCENETFQVFVKLCLKHGMSGRVELVQILKTFVSFVNFNDDEASFILEMVLSHSEFLDTVLAEDGRDNLKLEILDLIAELCGRWSSLMTKNHIPIFLSAYRATIRPSDVIILRLLQMYEKESAQTGFYDFQPFLWGTAAITYYSVKRNREGALTFKLKMKDIVENIKEDLIRNTITDFPLNFSLQVLKSDISPSSRHDVYDLRFFLPLFNWLLSSEKEVSPVTFINGGCLSMIIVAFSAENDDLRSCAAQVLSRLYHHVDATLSPKSKGLWGRFIEAFCRGINALPNFKLNNFVAVFWAKMVLVLSQPSHPLTLPLSRYLETKEILAMNAIPELYTFLHFSDVDYKEVRAFILDLLCDGMRTEEDFMVALQAMSFKLLMELFSSCLATFKVRLTILKIIERACVMRKGRESLCSRHGLKAWISNVKYFVKQDELLLLSESILKLIGV